MYYIVPSPPFPVGGLGGGIGLLIGGFDGRKSPIDCV